MSIQENKVNAVRFHSFPSSDSRRDNKTDDSKHHLTQLTEHIHFERRVNAYTLDQTSGKKLTSIHHFIQMEFLQTNFRSVYRSTELPLEYLGNRTTKPWLRFWSTTVMYVSPINQSQHLSARAYDFSDQESNHSFLKRRTNIICGYWIAYVNLRQQQYFRRSKIFDPRYQLIKRQVRCLSNLLSRPPTDALAREYQLLHDEIDGVHDSLEEIFKFGRRGSRSKGSFRDLIRDIRGNYQAMVTDTLYLAKRETLSDSFLKLAGVIYNTIDDLMSYIIATFSGGVIQESQRAAFLFDTLKNNKKMDSWLIQYKKGQTFQLLAVLNSCLKENIVRDKKHSKDHIDIITKEINTMFEIADDKQLKLGMTPLIKKNQDQVFKATFQMIKTSMLLLCIYYTAMKIQRLAGIVGDHKICKETQLLTTMQHLIQFWEISAKHIQKQHTILTAIISQTLRSLSLRSVNTTETQWKVTSIRSGKAFYKKFIIKTQQADEKIAQIQRRIKEMQALSLDEINNLEQEIIKDTVRIRTHCISLIPESFDEFTQPNTTTIPISTGTTASTANSPNHHSYEQRLFSPEPVAASYLNQAAELGTL